MPQPATKPLPKFIILGRVGATYGVKGYNHIQSYSEPVEQILSYKQWMMRKNDKSEFQFYNFKGRVHAQGIVAQLEGVEDRDAAHLLKGYEIAVSREELPDLPPGEYYWVDLEGLEVETQLGVKLGTVGFLYRNAGHTNMMIKDDNRERHIPFIEPDFVTHISLEDKKIIVDWDPEL